MWIGTDSEGLAWLVKMRGRLAAARERLFSALADHVGIHCQRSVFLKLELEGREGGFGESFGRIEKVTSGKLESGRGDIVNTENAIPLYGSRPGDFAYLHHVALRETVGNTPCVSDGFVNVSH